MNYIEKRVRELRNKLIYNGDVPLELGCEVTDGTDINIILDADGLTFLTGGFNGEDYDDDELFNIKELEQYSDIKILGKPTSWSDVLRMIGKKKENFTLDIGISRADLYDEEKILVRFDLTRSPEEQDEEVLDKLINLVK